MGTWQLANQKLTRCRLLALVVCPFAICHLTACCHEQADAIKRYGEPDIVYELRGATGRWRWFGEESPARAIPPDEIGFIWLGQNHQAAFDQECRIYDGPLLNEGWRRFEQDRIQEAGQAGERQRTDAP